MATRRKPLRLTRAGAILHLQQRLQAQSYPRIQMGLIVAITGGAGLLASFLLLLAGVTSMAVRYPLALVCAYGAFLLMLWAWLRTQASDYVDGAVDVADAVSGSSGGGGGGGGGGSLGGWKPGGGGDFSGGGASASFDSPASSFASVQPSGSGTSGSSKLGDAVGELASGDDILVPLVVLLAAIGLALASLYVVYMAPALFAELLFEGTLSYSLYRHPRKGDEPNWARTAVRRTALPFALTALFLCGVGAALGHLVPGAHTVGEALHGKVR
ncbi:hypothetical protein [Ramlibacter sp.]|uniref:hypothetical protein n=1 Tax=Ramlibacter sp. TaxID=1917967 RepID=UPI0035B29935